MAHVQFTDELIKEYLLFRGFNSSLKAFENDLKSEKDKGFRADKLVDNFQHSVYNYDLAGLREAWTHLETKIFTRLEHQMTGPTRKLESALYKFYLVHALENNKADKVNEFFVKMTHELSSYPDWKDWFTIPYIKYPEESPTFAVYFTRQWQDSLFVSLHNFLASAYQSLPQPTLSAYEETASKIAALQKENDMLRRGLANMLTSTDLERDQEPSQDLSEINEDFHNISLEVKIAESEANILKLLRNRTSASASPKSLPSTQTKKQPGKKLEEGKRGSSSDGRASRRERDSSLDPSVARAKVEPNIEKSAVQSEGFLFLSQDEYNEHTKEITCLKLNGRGNMVGSVDVGGSLRVWTTPPSCRTAASFSVRPQSHLLEWVLHHERYILCGDPSGALKLLDTRDVQQVWEVTVAAAGTRLENIVSNPVESSAVIIVNGQLSILDLKTRKMDKKLDPGGEVNSCAFSQNGEQLVCGLRDGSLAVVSVKTNQVSETVSPLSAPIRHVHLCPDAATCFYLASDYQLQCFSLSNKEKLQTLSFPMEAQMPASWNKPFCVDSSGSFLLTLGSHSGVIFKITSDGISKCLKLGGHKSALTVIDWCFANQCATCVTASSDGHIRISTLLIDTVADT